MNDPILLATKLNELVQLASEASTGFEQAAIYSACSSIWKEFEESGEQFDGYIMEKVLGACYHIKAAVGYDVTNGHNKSSHISWAYGELMTLDNLLEERSRNV